MLAQNLIDEPEWYYRKRYNFAPNDPVFLDTDKVDIYLDLYMHAEHDKRVRREERGDDTEIESDPVANDAFDAALAAEAQAGDDGEEFSDDDFEDVMMAAARALIAKRNSRDEDTEEARALRALKRLLGDAYNEADFIDPPEGQEG